MIASANIVDLISAHEERVAAAPAGDVIRATLDASAGANGIGQREATVRDWLRDRGAFIEFPQLRGREMGWTHTSKGRGASILDFFRGQFEHRNDKAATKILDCAVVGMRTACFACEMKRADGRLEVVALVCLLNCAPKSAHNFGYKDMDESMGLWEAECPKRIPNHLTPTDRAESNKRRERCRENIRGRKAAPPMAVGMAIRWDPPLRFSHGWGAQAVTIVKSTRPLQFTGEGGFAKLKISRKTIERMLADDAARIAEASVAR